MKLNRDSNKGHHYITELGTVLNTGNGGYGDSLGRTARAMIVYDEDKYDLLLGVLSYFTGDECLRYQGSDELNSRDHLVIAGSCVKQVFNIPLLPKGLFKTNPRLTIGQRIWVKAMQSKAWSIGYMVYKLPGLAVWYPLKNFLLRLASWTLKTVKDPYMMQFFKKPTKWQKFCNRLQLPVFASFYTLYEIEVLESRWAKRVLQFVMKLHFEKSNYVARALCGEVVEYPEGYKPSRKNRWSIRLDRACNRDMTVYDDDETENLEMGMLKYYCK